MRYISTRGGAPVLDFEGVTLTGGVAVNDTENRAA